MWCVVCGVWCVVCGVCVFVGAYDVHIRLDKVSVYVDIYYNMRYICFDMYVIDRSKSLYI